MTDSDHGDSPILRRRVRELEAELEAARQDRWALRALLEALPQRVFWKDRDSMYLGGNEKLARDCGYASSDELPGKRDHDHFPKEEADFFVKCDREVMAQGEPLLDIEEPQTRANGQTSWLLTSKVPMRSDDGGIVGMLGTYMDITEQKETEEKLGQALVRATVSEAKTQFLTTVSHELRTPLTLVLGPIADLLNRSDLDSGIRDELVVVRRNALRLRRIVDDVLDLRKIESGMMRVKNSSVDIAGFTTGLLEDFAAAARSKGIALESEIDSSVGPVETDSHLLERVVINLVGNAIKFTPAGGEITVSLRRHGDLIDLSVSDTGPGIEPDQMGRLFDPYEQGESQQEGTGLGLAIVRQFTEALGGTVAAESQVGVGSCFRLRIPLQPAVDTAHVQSDRSETSSLGADLWAGALIGTHDEPETNDEAAMGEGIRILLVDDNSDMRDHMRRVLASLGTIESCENGRVALDVIEEFGPDVVLSDVMMPDLDGIELVRRLKASPRWRPIPVVLVTARAGNEAVTSGLDVGADDYVCKPFEPAELRARIRAAARLHRTYQELEESKSALALVHAELEGATQSLLELEPLALLGDALSAAADPLRAAIDQWNVNDDAKRYLRRLLAEARKARPTPRATRWATAESEG